MEVERRFSGLAELGEDGLGVETRSDGKMLLRGYCARYDCLSHDLGGFRERLLPGAFDKVLAKRSLSVIANFNHSMDHVLGRTENGTLTLRSDERGLLFEIDPPDTQFARDLLTQVRRRDIAGASFAMTVDPTKEKYDRDERGEVIRSIESVSGLFDCSIVTQPAYPQTSVALRSFEAWKAAQVEEPARQVIRIRNAAARAAVAVARMRFYVNAR
jgi:HK97 family phage prohead protease